MTSRNTRYDQEPDDDAIAIVGIGVLTPGAENVNALWDRIISGDPAFSVPGERWDADCFFSADPDAIDKTRAMVSGFVHTALSDPDQHADFATRWLRQALRESMTTWTPRPSDRHAFLLGYSPSASAHLEEATVALGFALRMESNGAGPADALTKRVREHLRLAGPEPQRYLPQVIAAEACAGLLPAGTETLTVDTACASALYAMDLGLRGIREGRYDVAVCGGAHVFSAREMVLFDKARTMSRTGDVRAFDIDANGTLFADGAGIVVLKKPARARADGDTILGYLLGIGTSSDGRGRAIYAPNPAGQARALANTFTASGIDPRAVGLIVGHATGTPVGDAAELGVLARQYATTPGCSVVSNKSVVGHLAYGAGVVSLAHALLAMRHENIPAQQRFTEQPTDNPLAGTALTVPTSDTPWPARVTPRIAAISAFGFGGTNAHMHVSDKPVRTPPPTRITDDIVLIGWSADLPGNPSAEDVTGWLAGDHPAPEATFGDGPLVVSPGQLRLPMQTLRAIDRSQVLAMRAVAQLRDQLGEAWVQLHERTGVFVAHAGLTRAGTMYGLRLRLTDLDRHVIGTEPQWDEPFRALKTQMAELIPAASEDSIPGMLASVISGRIANYFDLQGPNMTIDTGDSGAFAAIRTAASYLRAGDIDCAVVLGVNGNAGPEHEVLQGRALAEGAICLAVTRREIAQRMGFPILAVLDGDDESAEVPTSELIPGERSYLAADSALAVLSAVLTGSSGKLSRIDPWTGQTWQLNIRVATTGQPVSVRRHVDPDPTAGSSCTSCRTISGSLLLAFSGAK